MSLPSLATLSDLQDIAPDLPADLDLGQADKLLTLASAMVRGHAGRTWVAAGALSGVPDGVPEIVAMMVARALRNDGVVQEVDGNYSVNYGAQAADRLYLTKAEKSVLVAPKSAFSVDTYGDVGYLYPYMGNSSYTLGDAGYVVVNSPEPEDF